MGNDNKFNVDEFFKKKLAEVQREPIVVKTPQKSKCSTFGVGEKQLKNSVASNSQTPLKKISATCDPRLEYALDLFFAFADKNKDQIVQISITPARLIRDCVAFDITFLLDGPVDFYRSPETKDLFELFEQIDNESFCNVRHTINTFKPSSGFTHTLAELETYVLDYMKRHPDRHFVMECGGAHMKVWDV